MSSRKNGTAAHDAIALAHGRRSGYDLARMRYEVVLAPEAIQDLRKLPANERAVAWDGMERNLRYQPARTARSRVKRLRGVSRPQYRLRVEDLRIFYDIDGSTVEVLAIVPKARATEWLAQFGEGEL